jgi:hypothetical protein
MNAVERAMLYAMPLLMVIAEIVALATDRSVAPHHALNPLNYQPVFVATAVVVTLMTTRRAEVKPVLIVGLLLEALRLAFLGRHGIGLADTIWSSGLGFWYAALAVGGLQVLRSRGAARWQALDDLAIKLALPISLPLMGFFLWLTKVSLPAIFDVYYYAFDGLLPVPVARMMAEAATGTPWLRMTLFVAYHSLMAVVGLYIVMQRTPDGHLCGHLLSRWLLAACLGYIFYFLMPGTGPKFALGPLWPSHMPDPNAIPLALITDFVDAPRNVMPSLHTTWALLIVLAAARMGLAARVGAWAFLAATLASTLGLGEHYLVDLIVAVPFTVAVHGLASFTGAGEKRRARALAAAGGLAMTAGWLLAIRYGIDFMRGMPWLASAMVLVTVAASVGLLFLPRLVRPAFRAAPALPRMRTA